MVHEGAPSMSSGPSSINQIGLQWNFESAAAPLRPKSSGYSRTIPSQVSTAARREEPEQACLQPTRPEPVPGHRSTRAPPECRGQLSGSLACPPAPGRNTGHFRLNDSPARILSQGHGEPRRSTKEGKISASREAPCIRCQEQTRAARSTPNRRSKANSPWTSVVLVAP
jgi:hypothetical protein